jgi:hypothetical protein
MPPQTSLCGNIIVIIDRPLERFFVSAYVTSPRCVAWQSSVVL